MLTDDFIQNYVLKASASARTPQTHNHIQVFPNWVVMMLLGLEVILSGTASPPRDVPQRGDTSSRMDRP